MTVVITGASGFIGGALLKHLNAGGIECVGVCRSKRPGLYRVDDYRNTPSGSYLVHCADTSDRSATNANGPVLAAKARRSMSALLDKSYKRVIYVSSAILYGDQNRTPRTVMDPIYVVDHYTDIKSNSERMVLEAGGVVVRLSNVYGPGMGSTNVFSDVLRQIDCSESITMKALKPVRDFIWIDDVVRALQLIYEGAHASTVFNVGSGRGYSIANLVEQVQKTARTCLPVKSTRIAENESNLVLDISDTITRLGWAPQVQLDSGIKKVLMERERAGRTE